MKLTIILAFLAMASGVWAADDLQTSITLYRDKIYKTEQVLRTLQEKQIALEGRVSSFPDPVPTMRKKEHTALLAEQNAVITSCTVEQKNLDNLKDTLTKYVPPTAKPIEKPVGPASITQLTAPPRKKVVKNNPLDIVDTDALSLAGMGSRNSSAKK